LILVKVRSFFEVLFENENLAEIVGVEFKA